MQRNKFQQRSILLRTVTQISVVESLIWNLPVDPDNPIEILIREQVKQRGLDANGYYWMRIGEIAEQGWFKGRQYSKDVWHAYAAKYLMPEEIVTKDGDIRSKWVDCPDGSQTVISTTQLSKACFAEYTELVEVFGCGLGVHFKERDYG